MNNEPQVFTIEQVRMFNDYIRPWVVDNGTAKMLEDFDNKMKVFLSPVTPPTAGDNFITFMTICAVFGILIFALIGVFATVHYLVS